jgi:bifunctional ADP-heptose synthase (sugar kinase/adenylyltransferase)
VDWVVQADERTCSGLLEQLRPDAVLHAGADR